VVGKFAAEFVDMIQELMNEQDLRLQLICTTESGHQSTKRSRYGSVSVPCSLSLILYGPPDLGEDVGNFFQELELYLQDPKGCDLNAKYFNPHRLSSMKLGECPMTFSLHLPSTHLDQTVFQKICSDTDISDIFNAQQNLAEAPQPDVIQSQLKR
jgi:hypothetical protein